jgi:endogenous inhibitor of DNA gyrase (YacG/DUF329 family)
MMTNNEKEMIRELRMQGLGYGKVAERTGIKLETVKSYCRRHGLRGEGKRLAEIHDENYEYVPCKNCGKEIRQKPKRKKKQFCCDACRYQWWNQHLDQVNRKTYYKITCLNCGKEFRIYGDSRRKYCSHECYIEHRFGM